jgi:hypothetical protein
VDASRRVSTTRLIQPSLETPSANTPRARGASDGRRWDGREV